MKKKLHDNLNKYLANAGVMYIKIHNLHWNVVGPSFKATHEYLESLYDGFADVIDDVAETIKMQGKFPLASLKDFLKVATITELESKDYSVKETLNIVLADMETLKKQTEDIRAIASEDDNYAVVALMEENLTHLNKSLWFIKASMK